MSMKPKQALQYHALMAAKEAIADLYDDGRADLMYEAMGQTGASIAEALDELASAILNEAGGERI